MMRELDTTDPYAPSFDILPDTAVWTDYDYPWPTGDYTIDAEGDPVSGTRYELGLAQVETSGEVSYFHGDQIGTTRAMTDDPLPPGSGGDPPSIATRPVYTAFGEVVYEDGAVGTRYRYAGAWGYESFADLDWGTADWGSGQTEPLEFPYLHVGHRYYDPATGRFLQRDPIGIRGGLNAYAYASSKPTTEGDPDGLSSVVIRLLPAAGGAAAADGPFPVGDIIGGVIIVGALCVDVYTIITEDLGPSAKPKIHRVRHPTRKRAKDAARADGDGTPIHHPSPRRGRPHFHPTRQGRKRPVHHEYPVRCFLAGTSVFDGDEGTAIDALSAGEEVVSGSPLSGTSSLATVTNVWFGTARDIVTLHVEGDSVSCTGDHPFWVAGKGWTLSRDIRPVDELITSDGTTAEVIEVNIERRAVPVPVFSITVNGDNTFFVGRSRLLAHNKNVP